MFNELFYTKTPHGWRVYDRDGNAAYGATKQLAKNQYFLLYTMNKTPQSASYNMENVEKKWIE